MHQIGYSQTDSSRKSGQTTNNGRYAHVLGWGMYAPSQRLTNHEISHMVDTSDDWIRTRTGIKERRIAAEDETTATLATRAAESALKIADVPPQSLDLIIVASATPDHLFPATACLVQDALGADQAGAFDISAGCSGFLYALGMAAHSIQLGAIDTALVIGAETLSRFVDWGDRNTCVLFGDGAGAVVLAAKPQCAGILSCSMRANGSGSGLLKLPAGGSCRPASSETVAANQHTIKMQGREVFRLATTAMTDVARSVTTQAGLTLDDIAIVIPHQANSRIIDLMTRRLGLSQGKVYVNLDRYGNTSNASIPIALCEAVEARLVNPGDNVLLVAFGAGLTWAGSVIAWSRPAESA